MKTKRLKKIIPARCKKCLARRKRIEAKKWEDTFKVFARFPQPAILPKDPGFVRRVFKLVGGSN